MTMASFAAAKRRIQPGTRLLCVENTYRPELDGTDRTVVKVQTNGFYWTMAPTTQVPNSDRRNWTRYPKAADVEIVDADTWRMRLARGGHVELRFLS
jgi:hypothetical protein